MIENRNRPVDCRMNKDRKTSTLWFRSGNSAEFYLRGGICWPMMMPGVGLRGYAMLVGYDIETEKFNVFEEFDFVSIDHVIGDDQMILAKGLCKFVGTCWEHYHANRFYWHDVHETYRKYSLQILRSDMVKAKPILPEIDWEDDQQPIYSIFELIRRKRLRFDKKSVLAQALDQFEERFSTDPESKPPAEVRALMACIAGMEKHPWKSAKYGHRSY